MFQLQRDHTTEPPGFTPGGTYRVRARFSLPAVSLTHSQLRLDFTRAAPCHPCHVQNFYEQSSEGVQIDSKSAFADELILLASSTISLQLGVKQQG